MDRDQIKSILKSELANYVNSITSKSKSGMYVCPLCHSGEGANGTGAFSVKGEQWKCFVCQKGGDIFDLIGEYENIADYTEQVKRAKEIFNINSPEYQKPTKTEQYTHTHTHNSIHASQEEVQKMNFVEYYKETHKHLNETDYLTKRGISTELADRFFIGYDAKEQRIIIPINNGYYKARAISDAVTPKYKIPKGATTTVFNEKALKEAKAPIFIVEGELDAMSIIQAGGEAIGLGSTSNANKFLQTLQETDKDKIFIIALDNEEEGTPAYNAVQTATETLVKGFTERDIQHYVLNPYGACHDANEALINDYATLESTIQTVKNFKSEAELAEQAEYLQNATSNHLQNFINGISSSVATPYTETGFKNLDTVLEGGLYEGLYFIGAISSLGKTTLILQIADQIAQQGRDVLIFSLEMARSELIAKSISRHTLQYVLENGGEMKHAKTTRGITTGVRYKNYCKEELNIIQQSIEAYGKYANHIYITQSLGDIGAEQVRETVEKHIKYTGNTPVVVIDYLQILAPADIRATDKRNVDTAVFELKKISRDYKLPMIAISSLNRQNYSNKISMEAFKESGAIEYSSDVLLGLQLKGAGEKGFDVDEAKNKDPREIELVIMKNRNGKAGAKVEFKFYPMFNYFREE